MIRLLEVSAPRIAGALTLLLLGAALAGCMPGLPSGLTGSGPQLPEINVTVNTAVGGGEATTGAGAEASASAATEAPAAPQTASPLHRPGGGAHAENGTPGQQTAAAGSQNAGTGPPSQLDPDRAAAVDRAVQALEALTDEELDQVCAVICLAPK